MLSNVVSLVRKISSVGTICSSGSHNESPISSNAKLAEEFKSGTGGRGADEDEIVLLERRRVRKKHILSQRLLIGSENGEKQDTVELYRREEKHNKSLASEEHEDEVESKAALVTVMSMEELCGEELSASSSSMSDIDQENIGHVLEASVFRRTGRREEYEMGVREDLFLEKESLNEQALGEVVFRRSGSFPDLDKLENNYEQNGLKREIIEGLKCEDEGKAVSKDVETSWWEEELHDALRWRPFEAEINALRI